MQININPDLQEALQKMNKTAASKVKIQLQDIQALQKVKAAA